MTNRLTIAFTRREAELYQSHGLHEEAHDLYRQVLDNSTTLKPSQAAPLQERISQIEQELAKSDINFSDVVSQKELNILRESWGDAQSPSDICICALALSSLGLHKAAIEEYCKLIHLNHTQAEYVDGLIDCIVTVYTPETIGVAIDSILSLHQPPDAHPTALRIGIAVALARRGLDQPALELFQLTRAIQPLPDKVETLAKKIQKRLKNGPDSIDRVPATRVKIEAAAQQLTSYLADRLAKLQSLIHRLRKD